MANPTRTRKRVRAARRASDGSAFQNCEHCGVSVAVALADMHECEPRKDVKRVEAENLKVKSDDERFRDQPRSPFRFFMESFAKTFQGEDQIECDRLGFKIWKIMTKEEKRLYILKAEKVNSAYTKALLDEVEDKSWVNDEADSAEVGKFDERYDEDAYFGNSYSTYSCESF